MAQQCELDFGHFRLEAEIFDTEIGRKFYEKLPMTIELILWGAEAYGPIPVNLGEEKPVPRIPPGGLAYTNQGNYFCVFFGQDPAWSVEYLGRIKGDSWKVLPKQKDLTQVTVSRL